MFLTWLPTYLIKAHGFSLKEMGFYSMFPYLAMVIGSNATGWIADYCIRRTGKITLIRKSIHTVSLVSASVFLMLLAQAQTAVREQDFAAAETALGKAVTLATGAELADIARLRLARVQQAAERGSDALATLEQVRSVGMLSVAREIAGDIHLSQGDRKKAHESYAAALADLKTEDQRGLLEAKLADTADAADA